MISLREKLSNRIHSSIVINNVINSETTSRLNSIFFPLLLVMYVTKRNTRNNAVTKTNVFLIHITAFRKYRVLIYNII